MLSQWMTPVLLFVASIVLAKLAYFFSNRQFPFKLFKRRPSPFGILFWKTGKVVSVFILAFVALVLLLFVPLTIPHPV